MLHYKVQQIPIKNLREHLFDKSELNSKTMICTQFENSGSQRGGPERTLSGLREWHLGIQ